MANIPLNQAIILGRIELVRNFIQDGAKLEELDANGVDADPILTTCAD